MPVKQLASVKLIGRSHDMLGINMKIYAQLMSSERGQSTVKVPVIFIGPKNKNSPASV